MIHVELELNSRDPSLNPSFHAVYARVLYACLYCHSVFVAGLCKDSKEPKHPIMYNPDQPTEMEWPLQVSTANAEIHGAQVF